MAEDGDVDEPQHQDEDEAALGASVRALLADPQVWDEPPASLEDELVAAIADERDQRGERDQRDDGVVAPMVRPATKRPWLRPFVAGAAAAALLVLAVVGGVAVVGEDGGAGGAEVALAGTELAPDAAATATVADTPLGTRLVLDVTDLPPAPDGTYYEAWLRTADGEQGVSAGTFHLRGGDGEIELWAGVTTDQYPLLTVTEQREGEGAASSGEVVLAGRVDDAD